MQSARISIASCITLLCAMHLPVCGAGLSLQVDLARRTLAVEEPCLARIALSSIEDDPQWVIPPYVGGHLWPVSFVMTAAPDGDVVFEGAGRDYRGPIQTGSEPWWTYGRRRGAGAPWLIPAGAEAHYWLDLTQFHPLDEPGRYHITFHYRPTPEMAYWDGEGPAPWGEAWMGELEADAGWIEVVEPSEADKPAMEWLRDLRDRAGLVLSTASLMGPMGDFLAQFPDSAYAPYVEYYMVFSRVGQSLMGPPPGYEDSGPDSMAGQFTRKYPDFPLSYVLPVQARYRELSRSASQVAAHEHPDPAIEAVEKPHCGLQTAHARLKSGLQQAQNGHFGALGGQWRPEFIRATPTSGFFNSLYSRASG